MHVYLYSSRLNNVNSLLITYASRIQAFWFLTMSSRILVPVITKEDIPFTVNSEIIPEDLNPQ